MMKIDLKKLTHANVIGVYRSMRERKEALAEKHKAELKPFNEQMTLLENELVRRMHEDGTNSFNTDNGTAYKRTLSSVRVANGGAFFDWLRETDNWQLADVRAAKKEVEAWLEKEQSLPPGLDINRVIKCGVNKPTGVK